MKQEQVSEMANNLTIMPLNDFLDIAEGSGYAWFGDLQSDIEPYIDMNYDSDYYGDMKEEIIDEFESETKEVFRAAEERFEPLVCIDEQGNASVIPAVYDVQEKQYLSYYEMGETIANELPQDITVTAQVNPSFSWDNGWEYDEKSLTISMDDIAFDTASEKLYESIQADAPAYLEGKSITGEELEKYVSNPENEGRFIEHSQPEPPENNRKKSSRQDIERD